MDLPPDGGGDAHAERILLFLIFSRDFVVSAVSRHFQYSRDFVFSAVSRHLWKSLDGSCIIPPKLAQIFPAERRRREVRRV